MEENNLEKGADSPSRSTNPLKKLLVKPTQTRDTKHNEDSDKSDSESEPEVNQGDAIIEAVKEEAKMKKEREKRSNKKTLENLEEKEEFSWFNILGHIEQNTEGLYFYLAIIVYALVGCVSILALPLLVLLYEQDKFPDLFQSISTYNDITSAQTNVKLAVFLAAMFVSHMLIYLAVNRIVFVFAMLCDIFNRKITHTEKVILFIIDDVKGLLVFFFFGICGVIHCNIFLDVYSLQDKSVVGYAKIAGYSIFTCILCGFFIGEKFFLKLAIAYCGNNVFSGRIGQVNLKTSILRRIAHYANSVSSPMRGSKKDELLEGIEITDTFLVHFPDFKIKSKSQCEDIVYEILARISVEKENVAPKESEENGKIDGRLLAEIPIDRIREAFGPQWMDIWKYMEDYGYVKDAEESSSILGTSLLNLAVSSYTERIDLKRTLHDRDKILGTLDYILQSFVIVLSVVITTPFIGFDPMRAAAGIFPLLMSAGWIFSDVIKDVFNNFLFLLHEHPFDVGDKIVVKDKEFTVLRIELMYSTFTSRGGTVCYVPNKELIKESIFNIRRSDIQTELVVFVIKEEISLDKIDEIKQKAANILKSKELDGKKRITIQDYETKIDKTVVTFRIEYLCNFQEPEPKFTRRQVPIEIIQKAIQSSGLSYAEQKAQTSI